MKREGTQTLLRVFLLNTDKVSWWANVQDALLERAMRRQLGGATILEGICGLVDGEVVESSRWALVRHHPVVLEILDDARAIGGFLTDVAAAAPHALLTLERVRALIRRPAEEVAPRSAAVLPDPEEFPIMRTAVAGQLLRVFVDDTDTYQHRPVYQVVVEKARELGLSNAVVLRAAKGFGAHRRLRSDASPDYVSELPVLIEVVGTAEEIDQLMPFLDEVVPEGLITTEGVTMLRPKPGPGPERNLAGGGKSWANTRAPRPRGGGGS